MRVRYRRLAAPIREVRSLLIELFRERPIGVSAHQLNQTLHGSARLERTRVQIEFDAQYGKALVARRNRVELASCPLEIAGFQQLFHDLVPRLESFTGHRTSQ